jgi:hypothetical protein
VWRLTHWLGPARQDNVWFSEHNLLRSLGDSLESRTAEAIDSNRGSVDGQTSAKSDVAGQVNRIGGGLEDIAEDNVPEGARIHSAPVQRSARCNNPEFGGREILQSSAEATEPRANPWQKDYCRIGAAHVAGPEVVEISLDIELEICPLADQETTGYAVPPPRFDLAFTGGTPRMRLAGSTPGAEVDGPVGWKWSAASPAMRGIGFRVRWRCLFTIRSFFSGGRARWCEREIRPQVERLCQWAGLQTNDGIFVEMEDGEVGADAPELGGK